MDIIYRPYVDPDFELLLERIHPPRVCIDNDACPDCTLVKVDSANKHGILLEMVQNLTDLDLVISKSYICSDGGWFMDVFHVTDQLGSKITDPSLILYIQQALCASRREGLKDPTPHPGRAVRPKHVSTDHTALEMSGADRPGLMSEISAALAEMGCHVFAAVAWTHKTRVASIVYVEDEATGGPITDAKRLAQIEQQLGCIVGTHGGQNGERSSVGLTAPAPSRTHTERRLHQLMFADGDFERCGSCDCGGAASRSGGEAEGYGWKSGGGGDGYRKKKCLGTHVCIESCKEKGYSVVNVRSRDRPKLLFDTVCTLTDLQYVVFHAAVSSKGSIADQEYFVRRKDGCTLVTESERKRVTQCLIAAIERRVSHGMRLDVCTRNRLGLLSDVTRLFRENGLSISRAEIGMRGEKAIGSFYVTDASGNDMVKPETIELVRKEIGGTVAVVNEPTGWPSSSSTTGRSASSSKLEDPPRFSLGSLLWAQLERLSINFGPIKS
ncbi:ACT domain-containing protein ACR1 [Malania oleifera]|uniref:ACT domain-containing protein ACR1 n=1 Tax=Malania oleifera TaxID=397392 RepID=UPI0025AE3433|nr:ACT domain-containing protein ACR1 [Malania oleifera]XP_057969385.1 ACT domain-containing protein ACR1 [Malania oleifera]